MARRSALAWKAFDEPASPTELDRLQLTQRIERTPISLPSQRAKVNDLDALQVPIGRWGAGVAKGEPVPACTEHHRVPAQRLSRPTGVRGRRPMR